MAASKTAVRVSESTELGTNCLEVDIFTLPLAKSGNSNLVFDTSMLAWKAVSMFL